MKKETKSNAGRLLLIILGTWAGGILLIHVAVAAIPIELSNYGYALLAVLGIGIPLFIIALISRLAAPDRFEKAIATWADLSQWKPWHYIAVIVFFSMLFYIAYMAVQLNNAIDTLNQ